MAPARFNCMEMLYRNKGMALVLLWSLSGWAMFSFVVHSMTSAKEMIGLHVSLTAILEYGGLLIGALLFPIIGLIADVYWGRYKMIRRSLFIMWLATIAICVGYIIPDNYPQVRQAFIIPFTVILYFSTVGLQVNIIQFGIDQLPGASSARIIAFSNWFAWAYNVGYIITAFSVEGVCKKYTAVSKLLLPVCLTLALCLDYNFNHWLIKEPVSENPLKLIYRVMHYAWKNKYPRRRSAFTYSDDKRHSRIDFAKQKFGGPFTTEQVEDVKTFWRIFIFFSIMVLFYGFFYSTALVTTSIKYHLRYLNFTESAYCSAQEISNRFQKVSVYGCGYLVIIVAVPLYELVLYRFMQVPRLSILTKFNIGIFFAFLSISADLSLEVIGHIKLDADETKCQLRVEFTLAEHDHSFKYTLPLDYKWIMLPESLRAISFYFMLSGAIQFVCAQTPYTMKGLMLGWLYGAYGCSIIVGYILLLPITLTTHKWPPNRYGCETWYLLSVSIVLLLVFIFSSILSWRYKKRQREDTLPNEHIFAIDYYSRYTMHNSINSS